MAQLKHVLGDEYDEGLRADLLIALLDGGAVLQGRWAGVGGSQDITHEDWETPHGPLAVETETYMGLSIEGPAEAVEAVLAGLARVRARPPAPVAEGKGEGAMRRAARRLATSLKVLPDAAGWRWCAILALLCGTAMAALGFSTGLYRLTETAPGLPLRLLTVWLIPALGEEVPFRGLLVPDRGASRRPAVWIAASTGLYVAWHPLEALTFLPHAATFLRWDFLACTAILGLACALMRWRTGSLWPAVLAHGGFVIVWQTWLGGVSALG